LEQKFLELIGMPASVGSECRDCLEWHMNAAREAGATDRELVETIKMAQRVRMIATGKHEKFSSTVRDICEKLSIDHRKEVGAEPL